MTIFAKEAFLNVNPHEPFRLRKKPPKGHLLRVSSIIRGDQIAEAIGAKYNPTEGFENDICIYVKPNVPKGGDFEFKGRVNYLDIIDGHNLGGLLAKHPEVKGIVCSRADYDIMSKEVPNEIIYIPQHHCNFDRIKKESKKIKRIGIIGVERSFVHMPKELEMELEKRGIELVCYSKFYCRQDIIDFYMSIDLQIVWRPYRKVLSNPLKIVNAMSFGIPTIAFEEKAFEEVYGSYVGVKNLKELLKVLDELIAKREMYEKLSDTGIKLSESYHIDEVAKMYRRLE